MPIMGMDYICGLSSSDAMRIDDLLDFSEQDELFDAAATLPDNHNLPLHDVSSAAYDSSAPPMGTFSDDLYIPSEEAAELEWLSKFVDDSFSEIPIPSWNVPFPSSNSNIGASDDTVLPSRARSKRTKAAAPAALQQAVPSSSATSSSSSSSSSEFPSSVNPKFSSFPGSKKKEVKSEDGVRKCTHCASEKTPQWRTGPLGPKTLCNACGVRFKSGRLVPEYRPAASPTFILTQHSNSHRKVLELRRQKDLVRQPSSSELHYRDYEVC